MKKAANRTLSLLEKVIFIGFVIQAAIGAVWMCMNFAGFQEFGESVFYARGIEQMNADKYAGILYPVFLLFVRGVEKVIRLPYFYLVYALQLLTSCYASYVFLGTVWKKRGRVRAFMAFAMSAFPMLMQCHLAVLPHSFVCSFFLLEISAAVHVCCGKEEAGGRTSAKPVLFWLICLLLLPEYWYLGAVPALFAGIYEAAFFLKRRPLQKGCLKGLAGYFGMVLLVCGAGVVIYGNFPNASARAGAAVSRFAWTSLEKNFELWPEEVKGGLDREAVRESSFYADNIKRILVPLMEEAFGREQAKDYMLQIARICGEQNRSKILHEIAWDQAAYTVSPIALQMQLEGRGYDSYSGRNFDIMRAKTPQLTGIYMEYGCWWFAAALCLGAAARILIFTEGIRRPSASRVFSLFLVLCSCGCMILWYTFRGAGMMDYKLTIAVNCVWMLFSLSVCGRREGARTKGETDECLAKTEIA